MIRWESPRCAEYGTPRDERLRRARRYKPTSGMLLALADQPGATALDYERCRLRGLIDHRRLPTEAGRLVLSRERQRAEAAHG